VVKTADIAWSKWEGTDGEVYIDIHGSEGSSGRLVLHGGFEEGQLDINDDNNKLMKNLGEVVLPYLNLEAFAYRYCAFIPQKNERFYMEYS